MFKNYRFHLFSNMLRKMVPASFPGVAPFYPFLRCTQVFLPLVSLFKIANTSQSPG